MGAQQSRPKYFKGACKRNLSRSRNETSTFYLGEASHNGQTNSEIINVSTTPAHNRTHTEHQWCSYASVPASEICSQRSINTDQSNPSAAHKSQGNQRSHPSTQQKQYCKKQKYYVKLDKNEGAPSTKDPNANISAYMKQKCRYKQRCERLRWRSSPLICSLAHNGETGKVRTLLKIFGCHVDSICPETGATPLFLASCAGHLDVCKLLCDKGATVDQACFDGTTPLTAACYTGHIDVATLLLEHGACVNIARHTDGATVLMAALGSEASVPLLRQLLRIDAAGINKQMYSGHTVLHSAIRAGNVLAVQVLLKAGANMELVDNLGFDAMKTAMRLEPSVIQDQLLSILNKHQNPTTWKTPTVQPSANKHIKNVQGCSYPREPSKDIDSGCNVDYISSHAMACLNAKGKSNKQDNCSSTQLNKQMNTQYVQQPTFEDKIQSPQISNNIREPLPAFEVLLTSLPSTNSHATPGILTETKLESFQHELSPRCPTQTQVNQVAQIVLNAPRRTQSYDLLSSHYYDPDQCELSQTCSAQSYVNTDTHGVITSLRRAQSYEMLSSQDLHSFSMPDENTFRKTPALTQSMDDLLSDYKQQNGKLHLENNHLSERLKAVRDRHLKELRQHREQIKIYEENRLQLEQSIQELENALRKYRNSYADLSKRLENEATRNDESLEHICALTAQDEKLKRDFDRERKHMQTEQQCLEIEIERLEMELQTLHNHLERCRSRNNHVYENWYDKRREHSRGLSGNSTSAYSSFSERSGAISLHSLSNSTINISFNIPDKRLSRSLDSHLEETQLHPKSHPMQNIFLQLSHGLGKEYWHLGLRLGLSNATLERLQSDNIRDSLRTAYAMLEYWWSHYASGDRDQAIDQLRTALREQGRNDLLEHTYTKTVRE